MKERINTKHEGKRVLVIGPSGCGKSTVTLSILKANKDVPNCTVLSPSEGRNHTFQPHVPQLTTHDEFDTEGMIEVLEGVQEHQKRKCEKWEIPGTKPVEYTKDPAGIVVLDDCQVSKEGFKNKVFRYLFFNSRHDRLLVIMLSQYLMQIPAELRCNASHVFFFATDSPKEIKKLWEEFGVFEKLADFKQAYEVITSVKGRAMVIDRAHISSNKAEKIFYFHAPRDQEPFLVGTTWSNKVIKSRYDADWAKKRKAEPPSDPRPRKTARKGAAAKAAPPSKEMFKVGLVAPDGGVLSPEREALPKE